AKNHHIVFKNLALPCISQRRGEFCRHLLYSCPVAGRRRFRLAWSAAHTLHGEAKMRYQLAIALTLTAIGPNTWAQQPVIEQQLLSPLGQGFSYVPSPAPVDLVTVGPAGSRMAVYRNGEAGPRFDEIVATQPTSEGGGGIAVVFSADGSRYAYVGRKRDEFTLIVDGEEVLSGKYDGGYNRIAGVGFNAENHLFYRIRQQDEA